MQMCMCTHMYVSATVPLKARCGVSEAIAFTSLHYHSLPFISIHFTTIFYTYDFGRVTHTFETFWKKPAWNDPKRPQNYSKMSPL